MSLTRDLLNVVLYLADQLSAPMHNFPFVVEGAPNVMLETVKRGEEDFDPITHVEAKGKSVVLRLFEHMGGQANASLKM